MGHDTELPLNETFRSNQSFSHLIMIIKQRQIIKLDVKIPMLCLIHGAVIEQIQQTVAEEIQ